MYSILYEILKEIFPRRLGRRDLSGRVYFTAFNGLSYCLPKRGVVEIF